MSDYESDASSNQGLSQDSEHSSACGANQNPVDDFVADTKQQIVDAVNTTCRNINTVVIREMNTLMCFLDSLSERQQGALHQTDMQQVGGSSLSNCNVGYGVSTEPCTSGMSPPSYVNSGNVSKDNLGLTSPCTYGVSPPPYDMHNVNNWNVNNYTYDQNQGNFYYNGCGWPNAGQSAVCAPINFQCANVHSGCVQVEAGCSSSNGGRKRRRKGKAHNFTRRKKRSGAKK